MKVFIKTFGCELNRADSEVMAGLLYKAGFKLVDSVGSSDVVVVNSCGVKLPTQNKVLDYIKKIPKSKKVIVGGCLPKMLNVKFYAPNVSLVFDNNTVTRIVDVIKKEKSFSSDKKEYRICEPIVRIRKEVAIIPIAQGCLGSPCSYCSVKSARGGLKSYRKEDILRQVRKAVKGGCKKLRLTAQDTGCWGKDINNKLPELLKAVLKVKGNFEVRLGMSNPNYVLEYLDEMIKIYKNPKMKKFLHIPVQSGSDNVLKDMNRKYSVEDFKRIVNRFREEVHGISIATDIIVGFPTENEKDFEKTVELIKEVKPEVLNISKFGARPNTIAGNMKQLPSQEIKRRSVIMHGLWKSLNHQRRC